jgi:hypothetical protein
MFARPQHETRFAGALASVLMDAGWNVYYEAHPPGEDSTATTDPYEDEEAAREAFSALRHRIKTEATRIRWVVHLRHGDEVVEEFKTR